MDNTVPRWTDDDRRLIASDIVRRAARTLREAIEMLDGLEWSPALQDLAADCELVAGKIREYVRFLKPRETA